ncbi:general vesicular transport factor p115 isoform X2 [Pectinophora gossypiella]|uniref:general vesicular transport factor p115 isoform X2 n=1 Tax=Pectinophora gossypiella TaxID=13191 RepID=UPI00214F29BA|nr:general vesicular transport factor p115 isoform X2 [Pectinophora gossypiella]
MLGFLFFVNYEVERLVDRVTNSTLLEDRRDACRALKAMSRKYRVEVGAQGMDTLKQVLELDRADNETINYALDTLNNVMSPAQFEEEEDNPHVPMNIGEQFTEMFIKDPHNIQLVLDLLDEYDFRVRLSTVQLLTSLLTNRPKDIQEIILVKPMGVSKMMDLLGDTREVIRNETLLLLIKLTKGNANIQKIVAFENAFDRLFEIVSSEGYSDGGIIVEDCLLLMLNLLKNNSSNINFFKEGSYIQKMLPMFNTPDESEELGWSPQKVSNVHCMLQIVRTLVSPSNSAHIISSCQKIIKNVGLLEGLCNILMASGVPADILTETINTVGEVVRGDVTNQDYLGNVMAPSNPPRPAIVVLLMSMVNEKQPFSLRCAVLYCFQCYLYHNEMSQAGLVQTLLPSSTDVSSLTSGQLLCGGLFSSDALSNWFAAAALLRALCDNPVQKEQLLRVLLATNIGSSPVTLLHQCTLLLQQTTKLQSKVALLMLLSQWMSYCPPAVSAFLKVPGGVGFLVNQTCSNEHDENECLLQGLCAFLLAICIHFNDDSVENYSKDSLKQLLVKRIGMETFVAKLSEVSKHELYNKAAKHPQLRVKSSAEILIDYEFCRLFKVLESILVHSLTEKQENGIGETDRATPESDTLEQYKTLIRQQDGRLQELMTQVDALIQQNQALQGALGDSQASNSLLKDENTLLKAQVSAAHSLPQAQAHTQPPAQAQDDKVKEYEARIQQLDAQLAGAMEALRAAREGETRAMVELDKLRKDQDDLLELLADQDIKINEFKMRLLSLGHPVEEEAAPGAEPPQPA